MFIAMREVVNQGGLHSPRQNKRLSWSVAPEITGSASNAELLLQLQQFGGNSPDIGLNGLDRLPGVDHVNLLCRPGSFYQKTLPNPLAIFVALAFHSI